MEYTRACPVCGNRHHELLFKTKLENFDQYECFNDFRLASCKRCGFILNDTSYTLDEINRFYTEESPYSNASAYGAGGNSNSDMQKYERYLSIIKPIINKNSRICDVGCAKGGFLNFLATNGFKYVYGVEMSPKLVEMSKISGLNVKIGSAERIPLPEDKKKYDCLFFTNVFEHLFDLSKVLSSISDCLTDDGYVFSEVPDCENYSNVDFYPYYYLLNPREHINHFSADHLTLLMKQSGFDCVYTEHSVFKLNNSRYGCNSALIMIFNRSSCAPPPLYIGNGLLIESPALYMKNYIMQSEIKIKEISKITTRYKETEKPLYIWGIASDFFIAASFTDLLKCNIIGLIDKNTDKQRLSYRNIKIHSLEALKKIKAGDTLFMFSVYNNDAMKQYFDDLSIKCNFIDMTNILK